MASYFSNNGLRTTDYGPARAPAWFRYGVIGLAMLVLCSCTAAQPEYRIAETTMIRGQSPESPATELKIAASDEEPVALPEESQVSAPEAVEPISPISLAQPSSVLEYDPNLEPVGCNGACAAPAECNTGCYSCNEANIRGPRDEYLCDGGDNGLQAGVRVEGNVVGLEQEDTIAHYDTVDGQTITTPSNKVCIYAPRFAAIRQVIDVREYERYVGAGNALQRVAPAPLAERQGADTALAQFQAKIDRTKQPPSLLRDREHPGELDRDRRAAEFKGSLAPYANLQVIRSGEIIGEDIVKIARSSLAAITWAGDQAAQVLIDNRRAQADVSVLSPGTIYRLDEPNHPMLRLIKLASRGAAHPGEEVEFTLRFDNIGDRVIGNVTIVDNLTTRLEYVEGSQKSSLAANFSTQVNEGDSLVLRWELKEPLEHGKGGVLQFKAKVR